MASTSVTSYSDDEPVLLEAFDRPIMLTVASNGRERPSTVTAACSPSLIRSMSARLMSTGTDSARSVVITIVFVLEDADTALPVLISTDATVPEIGVVSVASNMSLRATASAAFAASIAF